MIFPMHKAVLSLWLGAALPMLAFFAAPEAAAYSTLDPGGPPHLSETVPVQIVMIGYEPGQVPEAELLAALPATSNPVIVVRAYYGIPERVGLDYTYDYHVVYADTAYEDSFFNELKAIGVPETEVTGYNESAFQFAYNQQATNVLEAHNNLVIDATAVEQWLLEHPAPGIDPERDTLVLINWWGRDDFRFHTYQTRLDADPDTGVDFGDIEFYGRLDAWGGTPSSDEETGFGRDSRLWFHDLSAGPTGHTFNWDLDDADVDGDGFAPDYRLPPIWEYLTPGGYRAASALPGDLAKLARYVAIDLLFTASPFYPPYLNDHRLPADIELDITAYDDTDKPFLLPAEVEHEVGKLIGRTRVDAQFTAFGGEPRRCYVLLIENRRCHPEANADAYGYPLANLFLSQATSLKKWRDGSAEHEAAAFIYAVSDPAIERFGSFTDDNWLDGTQSAAFVNFGPEHFAEGYGATWTTIHEYGHYFGLSHPHDGVDSTENRLLVPSDVDFYLWNGDQVNSVMNYRHLSGDFSQFDLDNMHRWQAAAHLRSANAIAANVLASSGAAAGGPALLLADQRFQQSQSALAAHDYVTAQARAREGYSFVRQAANAAGVAVPATDDGWYLLPPGRRYSTTKRALNRQVTDTLDAMTARNWPAMRRAQELKRRRPKP